MDAAIRSTCTQVRRDIINMTADAGCGHPGGSLSIVETLVALYFEKMNINPKDPHMEDRDRFVLSKGHAAPALYAVLGERGFFSTEEFKRFRQLGSILQGHPDMKRCPGVDASTGSLGQGISIAVGMAIGAKAAGKQLEVYTIIGDGESQEGLVWEASMAAAQY
ncbi:MAG: 1-deoxy-D-xylulose-5-phosphate synthase N-terminal domain-containing protein, partial [Clostridia bacterium]